MTSLFTEVQGSVICKGPSLQWTVIAAQKRLKSGLRMTVKGAIADGDKVALEAESYGELTNGRVYNQHYSFVIEFRGGKINAVREYLDTQHAYAVWFEKA